MKVGLQMYSVKELIAENPREAFEKVAALGYRRWEICQLYGREDIPYPYGLQMPPRDAVAMLDSLGVQVIGSHLTLEQIQDAAYVEDCLQYMAAIGCPAVGLGSAFFAKDDLEALKVQCGHFNSLGQRARAHGLRFYYHNHFQEFQRFGGRTVYEMLMAYTDPDLVDFELDTYWAMRAGQDPAELINTYGGRISRLHQKDFPKDAPQAVNLFSFAVDARANLTRESFRGIVDPRTFTEVGTGIMDIQGIIDAGNAAGIPYVILEQDQTQLTELESIARSMAAFRTFAGVDWE